MDHAENVLKPISTELELRQGKNLESGSCGQCESSDGIFTKPALYSSDSKTTGAHNPGNAASSPIGSLPGATGAAEKHNGPYTEADQQQDRETLAECLRTLRSAMSSLPVGTPENLKEIESILSHHDPLRVWGIQAADRLLVPAGRESMGPVGQLMMHYPQQYSTDGLKGSGLELMKAIKRQVIADWVEDLAEYPMWAVERACKVWRRSEKGMFRPAIADMRKICEAEVWQVRADRKELASLIENRRRRAEDEADLQRDRRKRFGVANQVAAG